METAPCRVRGTGRPRDSVCAISRFVSKHKNTSLPTCRQLTTYDVVALSSIFFFFPACKKTRRQRRELLASAACCILLSATVYTTALADCFLRHNVQSSVGRCRQNLLLFFPCKLLLAAVLKEPTARIHILTLLSSGSSTQVGLGCVALPAQ